MVDTYVDLLFNSDGSFTLTDAEFAFGPPHWPCFQRALLLPADSRTQMKSNLGLPLVRSGGLRLEQGDADYPSSIACPSHHLGAAAPIGPRNHQGTRTPHNPENQKPPPTQRFVWSGWPDLNRRPLDPQSSALPSCATAR